MFILNVTIFIYLAHCFGVPKEYCFDCSSGENEKLYFILAFYME